MAEEKSTNILARPAFIVSGLLVVALLVGLGFLVVTRDAVPVSGENTASPSSGASGAGAGKQSGGESPDVATAGGAGASDSVCGLSSLERAVPEQALPSVPVQVGERITVPSINGYGPGMTDGISRCFAHSPAGAILASANFLSWFSSKERLDEVVPALMAAGADRDRLEAQIKAEWKGETGSALSIHGFRFEDRGPDAAMVVLAVSSVSVPDTLVAWPVVLVWQDGDWKVKAPSTDSWGERVIDSLALEGFVEWSA